MVQGVLTLHHFLIRLIPQGGDTLRHSDAVMVSTMTALSNTAVSAQHIVPLQDASEAYSAKFFIPAEILLDLKQFISYI